MRLCTPLGEWHVIECLLNRRCSVPRTTYDAMQALPLAIVAASGHVSIRHDKSGP